jgi:O-antigen/teichoic acid export membrane protein
MNLADRQQTIRNVLALILAQAAAAGIGFIAFVRIASIFQVVELGRYGFAASSTALFGLLAELGMRYIAIKEIAVDKGASVRVLHNSFLMRALLSIVTLAFLAGVSELYPPWRNETRLLLLAGLVAVTQFGAEPITWVLFGHGRVDIGAAVLVVDRVLYVVAINAAAVVFRSAESLFAAAFIANIIRSVLAWLWVRPLLKDLPNDRSWDPALLRRLLVDGIALGVAVVVSVGYAQSTTVIAQSATSPAQLGYYAVGIGLVNISLIVPMALTNALFPALAGFALKDEVNRFCRTMMRLMLVTAVPLGAVMFVLAEPLLLFWVGGQYLPAAPALRILSIGMIAAGFNYLYRIFLFAQNRPWIETSIDIAALLAMIAAGWLAGSRYGSAGIAAVYAAVEVVVLIVKAFAVFRMNGLSLPGRLFLRGLAAAIIPAALVMATPMPVRFRALLLVVIMAALMALLDVVPLARVWQVVIHMGRVVQQGAASGER